VLALTGIVLVAGFGAESYWGTCTNAIPCAGSLVVCLGIVFGVVDVRSVYERRMGELVAKLEEMRAENDIVFSDADLAAEIRGSTNYFKKRALAIKERGQKRVIIVDAGILVLGTVVWGFGDLFIGNISC